MSSPFVSIVVPVYNVEAYLPRCLESIENQTFRDFECILVDDGSSDGSGAICDEQVRRDPRFRVLHKLNGGVAAARNSGMELARGRYLTFSDDDDILHPQLLELALAAQADAPPHTLVCWKYGPRFSTGAPLPACSHPQQVDELFLSGDFSNVWGKLWEQELLHTFSLRFNEALPWCEDLDFVIRYLLALHKQDGSLQIRLIPHVLYLYQQLRPGNVTSQYSPNKLICEQQILSELLDLFGLQLGQDRTRWARFCHQLILNFVFRFVELQQSETRLSSRQRRRKIRSHMASPSIRRLMALCRQYHVWPAMQLCFKCGLVRSAFFLQKSCYKPWYTGTVRAWLWVKNKFYWGWQALKCLFSPRKG